MPDKASIDAAKPCKVLLLVSTVTEWVTAGDLLVNPESSVAHVPRLIDKVPCPIEAEGEVYAEDPENSRVCCDAKDTTLISESKLLAVELSDTDIDNAEFALDGTYLLEFARESKSVFSELNSLTTSAKVDISVSFVALSSLNIFFLGIVSASTKLSTICVIFNPDPFLFRTLR